MQDLDDVHSVLVSALEDGREAAVLRLLASELGQVPALDKAAHDPMFWQQAVVNLNELADALGEESDLRPDEDDWELAARLEDDPIEE